MAQTTGAEHISETVKHLGDGTAIGVLLATWAQVLPHVASLLTVVWMAIRIYETDTVQGLIGRRRQKEESNEQD